MYDDFAPKLADLLTRYSQPLHGGERVVIVGTTATLPMVYALAEAILRKGAHPVPLIGLDQVRALTLELGNDEQLAFVNPGTEALFDSAEVLFNIMGTVNTRADSRVDAAKTRKMQAALIPVTQRYRERRARGEARGCIFAYPTQAGAQEANRSLLDWTRFIYEACGLQHDDPAAFWLGIHAMQDKLVNHFNGKSSLQFVGDGIDLSMQMDGRTWVNSDGKSNMPSGEIFSAPVEDSVNGHVHFNLRNVRQGRELTGVKLTFKDGQVVDASATANEDFLKGQLELDAAASYLGEIAIGTNYGIKEISGNTLFDEKIGGTIHMALGRSIPGTGGQNESALHWDLIHDMHAGEILLDGEVVYRNGSFVDGLI